MPQMIFPSNDSSLFGLLGFAICDPPQENRDKGDSMLTTRKHNTLSVSYVTDMCIFNQYNNAGHTSFVSVYLAR